MTLVSRPPTPHRPPSPDRPPSESWGLPVGARNPSLMKTPAFAGVTTDGVK